MNRAVILLLTTHALAFWAGYGVRALISRRRRRDFYERRKGAELGLAEHDVPRPGLAHPPQK
jgi:hypothetical protein